MLRTLNRWISNFFLAIGIMILVVIMMPIMAMLIIVDMWRNDRGEISVPRAFNDHHDEDEDEEEE